MNSEFTTLFVWVLLASSIAFAKRGAQKAVPEGAIAMRYHWSFQSIGWLSAVAINALSIATYLQAPEGEATPQLTAASLMFVNLVCLSIVLETTFVTVLVSEQGVLMRSPWVKTRRIEWSQVTDIQYSKLARWWTVRSQSGTKIRVATMLSGAEHFTDLTSRFCPRHSKPIPAD